jgi:hypothetical protein
MVFAGIFAVTSAWAQVDGDSPSQDTLYIIEEQVTYDTLYLYDSLPQPALMTKEELLDAFRKDRGIGKLYFQRGHMYLTGDGELFQLNDADLESFLSTSDYADWRKSKVNRIVSIPLYVLAGGGAVCAGLGFYQFCAAFVQTAKYGRQLLDNDALGPLIMRSAFSGFFVFLGSAVVTTAFIVPAVVLSVKGRATANRIADGANAPSSATQLRVGPTPSGVGVCLSF